MSNNHKDVPAFGLFVLMIIVLDTILIEMAFLRDKSWYVAILFTIPAYFIVKRWHEKHHRRNQNARNEF